MANTGFIINTTVRQFFISGPNSGSTVDTGSDVDLTVSPFSASLDNETFYNRVLEPEICPEGFETCLPPLLTSINTGSLRGRFAISYVTQSSFNTASAITASVSNDINFSTSEVFSASIDSIIPVTTSFTSGTIYFKAFTSCSGPDPSAESELLSFTYDLLPKVNPGDVQIVFRNNYSSTMQVEVRSLRGNANYLINPRQTLTYDYTNAPEPGAWAAEGKSADLNITIKGGANSTYGNYIQRVTNGVNQETYTTGGGFENPLIERENSNSFAADRGISFNIKQLSVPTGDTPTITTFTLLENTPPPPPPPPPLPPPDPGPQPAPLATISPESVFGSVPFSTENNACSNVNVNFRERQYWQLDNYLYDNLAAAQTGTKTTFPFSQNFIIISRGVYLIVNKKGYITNRGGCRYPTIRLYTLRGSYGSQQEACARSKTSPGSQTFTETNITLPDGRYPIYDSALGSVYRGGTNAIVANRQIIAIENCGSELTPVQYSVSSFTDIYFQNPFLLQRACSNNNFQTYYLAPDGLVYYPPDAGLGSGVGPYIPLGLNAYYKAPDGSFVRFNRGVITDTINPC
jgi:hypothetical protein